VRRERECGEECHDEQAFHTCKNSIRPTLGGVESKPKVVHGLSEVFLMRPLLAALVLALALPAAASAGLVTMHVREVPLHGARSLEDASPVRPFDMLAVHWIGTGSVEYRTRAADGTWRPWHSADGDYRSGPWHDGGLDWTGASVAAAFRTQGTVERLRSYELQSRVLAAPVRATAAAGTPAIVSRASWHANEEIVRARPVIASSIRIAIVHHTAGTNNYTRAQAAAIVRGIELYHVVGNGWNDIGYNFLVDRFGTIYEGRGGGIDRNVVGAHAQGFNVATVGVALIGSFNATTPTRAQQDALVQLLAWRLDVAHVDPESRVLYTSGGNYKYPAGRVVTLRAISGHRDTGPTECPGARAYGLLSALTRRVAATGLPKLYGPEVVGVLGGPLRFHAQLSAALSWTVTVTDRVGDTVGSGAGRGSIVDWTWSSAGATTGPYTWTIAAPGVRPAVGRLGPAVPQPFPVLSLTGLQSLPAVLAPAADGSDADATATFTLGAPARVTAALESATSATVVPLLAAPRPQGLNVLSWSAGSVPDGRYRLLVTATAVGRSVTKSVAVVVDRTLTSLLPSALYLSPNGDGVDDSTSVTFTLDQAAPVRVDVRQAGVLLATVFQGALPAGPGSVTWNGTVNGALVGEGTYQLVFTVTGPLGEVSQSLSLTIDLTPPTLNLVSAQRLTFTLSEPATVTLLVNGQTKIAVGEPAGTFTVPFVGTVTSVVAQAQDFAGNLSPAVSG
jgi:N-acetylmuramoyl-L-alanine amidase